MKYKYLFYYAGDFLFDTFQPFFFYKDNAVTYNVPKYDPPHFPCYLKSITTNKILFIFKLKNY